MGLEIERKFLVASQNFKDYSFGKITIKQGFLNSHKERTVRVRVTNTKAYLTIKGKSNKSGTSRFEWENEISVNDAESLLLLCEENIIEKNRFLVKNGVRTFEVDEFLGLNNGLVIAEIELSNENEYFEKPTWLGVEVTGQKKYYNSNLSKHPFLNWK